MASIHSVSAIATRLGAVAMAILATTASVPARAQGADLLTGDQRLACEAILCLSTGNRPAECTDALRRYFDIKKRLLSATLDARLDFLNLCPAASADGPMKDLVSAISRGIGRCEPDELNRTLLRYTGAGGDAGYGKHVISNRLPSYCSAYYGHEYVYADGSQPRYVGTPDEGGYWTTEASYPAELEKYQAALAARKEAEQRMYGGGN